MMKGILFNQNMVRAILDGRKTVTRRVVKHGNMTPLSICRPKLYKMVEELNGKPYFGAGFYRYTDVFFVDGKQHIDARYFRAPYRPGDILYVREKYAIPYGKGYYYAADYKEFDILKADNGSVSISKNMVKWHPSIHMPREAARIFLRVTEVWPQQLRDVIEEDAKAEGFDSREKFCAVISKMYPDCTEDSWFWAIKFERISKEEAGVSDMSEEKVENDAALEKWFLEHPGTETTVMKCEKCGLYYKPLLGHKCKKEGDQK